MGYSRTHEARLLEPAEALLQRIEEGRGGESVRFEVLEAASSVLGGYSLGWLRSTLDFARHLSEEKALKAGHKVVDVVEDVEFHSALALASLGRTGIEEISRRDRGVYCTDYRLARYAGSLIECTKGRSTIRVLDPACGTGNLLVAAALELGGANQSSRDGVIRECLFGADLSQSAVRAALVAIASLTDDRETIESLASHLRVGDSLIEGGSLWSDVGDAGFDIIIANPPWRKVKVTRHDFLRAKGVDRDYGRPYETEYSVEELRRLRSSKRSYVERLKDRFSLQGSGDPDLYQLFTELGLRLLQSDGQMVVLLPGGLIRSKGCTDLRRFLFEKATALRVSLFDNSERFFRVDSRKKFTVVNAKFRKGNWRKPISLRGCAVSSGEIVEEEEVRLGRTTLRKIEPVLTIPEVRTSQEWRIYRECFSNGQALGCSDGSWDPVFVRELDMTRDRDLFRRKRHSNAIPLVEGRMVHQFRHDTKEHVSGSGRSAVWRGRKYDEPCEFVPQYWVDREELGGGTQSRVESTRAGFCDITGQTNERSMLAARIPPGVVCGNKVPTIQFDQYSGKDRIDVVDCFVGIVNSLVFDWLLRRNITTSVNYFILRKLPMPAFDPLSIHGRRVADLARRVGKCRHYREGRTHTESCRSMLSDVAEWRAEIEWRVCEGYGLDVGDLKLVLEDFPLLDRGQPPLPGEQASTITEDWVLAHAAEALNPDHPDAGDWVWRAEAALDEGAVPFVPSHLADVYCDPSVEPDQNRTEHG